jgi:hypothetical protein
MKKSEHENEPISPKPKSAEETKKTGFDLKS